MVGIAPTIAIAPLVAPPFGPFAPLRTLGPATTVAAIATRAPPVAIAAATATAIPSVAPVPTRFTGRTGVLQLFAGFLVHYPH